MNNLSFIRRITGITSLLIFTSPVFLIAQSDKVKNETLMAQADTLLSREDYTGALALYNKIVEKSKTVSDEDYSVYYKRAFCYYGLERFDEALKDINQFIQKKPDDQAKLLRAYINQELGNYEDQLKDVNEFIGAHPDNVELLQWRASVFMEMERYKDAQKDIREILKYQDSPELRSYLGLTYYYLDQPDSALTIFDEVIAKEPDNIQTYLYAASLSLEQDAYELALQYIDRGLKKDPGNNTLLFYRGIALVETDKVTEGCRCLTKVFAAGFDDAGDYLKSYCYGVD
jgi:tetratricopeptide (TPR) repeat protein